MCFAFMNDVDQEELLVLGPGSVGGYLQVMLWAGVCPLRSLCRWMDLLFKA